MAVSTNYSTPVSTNSENYGQSTTDTDVLLIETGDELLLESGTDSLLLEEIVSFASNFVKGSQISSDFVRSALEIIAAENGAGIAAENWDDILSEREGVSATNFVKPTINSVNYS